MKILKRIGILLMILALIGIMLTSVIFLCRDVSENIEQDVIFDELIEIANQDEQIANNEEFEINDINEDKKFNSVQEENKSNTINFTKLQEINNDIVGWIKIDGTNINYPVMQTIDSPNYYINKNFYKEYSVYGTPYLSEVCNVNTSDNLTIYAHHIKNGKMFGSLEKYKNKGYYESHKTITFITKEEISNYEIIAVFKTVADDTGFKYYNFYKAQNEKEYKEFINTCKNLSFYDIDKNAEYGDKLITLSTCEYSNKNGRLVVVAKKI